MQYFFSQNAENNAPAAVVNDGRSEVDNKKQSQFKLVIKMKDTKNSRAT